MWQKMKNFYHLLVALLANIYYRFPSKKLLLIGITGTDGKTTTANVIYQILKAAGKKVSLITSVNAQIGERKFDTGFHVTTPDPTEDSKFLRMAVDQGSEYFVMEATSHGLDQNRLAFCNFNVGVLTNITHDHLDYHQTHDEYVKAKAKLFKKVKWAILNREDESFEKIKKFIDPSKTKIITYGLKAGDFTIKKFPFTTPLPGEYNQHNCLAAAACCHTLGVSTETIKKVLKEVKPIIGRLEKIDYGQGFQVFIDFAHTPNALQNVLSYLKTILPPSGRLIAVFGSAGLRDRTKRPKMGETAARLADIIVLTAEDPRTEDVNQIINQIAEGCKRQKAKVHKIPDRQEAINFAVHKLAKKGDIVVITGKGHERSMCFGKIEYPWSDQQAVKQALKKLKKGK
jgi:UDP-N-acetylmuramoyl-L-alanyl-D-glutamate--2,6-diaminopimelate ligase